MKEAKRILNESSGLMKKAPNARHFPRERNSYEVLYKYNEKSAQSLMQSIEIYE